LELVLLWNFNSV